MNTITDVNDGSCDTSHCSLREAIAAANAHTGTDEIRFDIGSGSVQTISLISALPDLTDAVVIDGTTEPGFAGAPIIELDGDATPSGTNGLSVRADNCTIRGLTINGFADGSGIAILGGEATVVEGNYIGTDASGTGAAPNRWGVRVDTRGNRIGGTTAGARNVISSNDQMGIWMEGSENRVIGNYIGVDVTGEATLGNGTYGVFVLEARDNLIGSNEAGRGNVLSGNGSDGVYIHFSCGTSINQNRIGTDVAGMATLGNGRHGVMIAGDYPGGCEGGNRVGGESPGSGNAISGNTRSGIYLDVGADEATVQANFIGTDVSGTVALGNITDGVYLSESDLNMVGGNTQGAGNLISGNGSDGVSIFGGAQNQVLGNLIGTDAIGTAPLGNGSRGLIVHGTHNSIGNGGPNGGNVISGNSGAGILIGFISWETMSNSVAGNLIGLDRTGLAPLGNGGDGILLLGENNIIGGPDLGANHISGNGRDGIAIYDGTGNTIQGNYIGTDVPGGLGIANAGNGISVWVENNLIGGSGDGEGNLVSGNTGAGVSIQEGGTGNQIQGNIIGTDIAGGLRIANGGPDAADRNLISGNDGDGIDVDGDENLIQNNYIGTDIAGTGMIGNEMGIYLEASASGNTIGGTGAGNFVAFNRSIGISIGVPSSAEPDGSWNQMLNNSVFGNEGLGIDLAPAGVTPNDEDDPDTGVNLLQNFPDLILAVTDGVHTIFTGTLNSRPDTTFTVQYFTNNECDPSGYGEGRRLVRTSTVTTNPSGTVQLYEDFPDTIFDIPQYVTATATDLAGNTSEFSNCIPVTEGPIVEPEPEGSLSGNAFCRLGPGTAYFAQATFNRGQTLMVAGRSADGRPLWFWVEMPDRSGHCWVSASVLDFPGVVEQLEVVEAQPLPAAPTGLAIVRRICGPRETYTILLQWVDAATNETGYRLYRNGDLLASLGANSQMYTELPPAGGPYTYEVEAVNAYGASPRASVTEAGCP